MTVLASTQQDLHNSYYGMSPPRQKVWDILQRYCQRYSEAFPSHATIAIEANCHRETVIKAIQFFAKKGWVRVIKRAYQTCVYIIHKALLFLRPDARKISMQDPEIEDPRHHSDTIYESIDTYVTSFTLKEKRSIADAVVDHPLFEIKTTREQAYRWFAAHPSAAYDRLNALIELESKRKCANLPQELQATLTQMAPKLCIFFASTKDDFVCETPSGPLKTPRNGVHWQEWLFDSLEALGNTNPNQIISAVDQRLNNPVN